MFLLPEAGTPQSAILPIMLICVLLAATACDAWAAGGGHATASSEKPRKTAQHRVVHKKSILKRGSRAHQKTMRWGKAHTLLSLRSGSALVMDAKTNQVLLSKNAGEIRPIASLTKLMTAAVILDAHQPMNQIIEITHADIDTLKWSSSRLRPGMKLSREELLKLALMSSENRAAHALARNYPGGLGTFMQAMNHKARLLGMTHTHYFDPTGLSPQNESTAHDLALLMKAVSAYPLIRKFSTHEESTVDVGKRELQYRNTDHLLFNQRWNILLSKTGYINEAGYCLALNAVMQGRKVIVVLLDAWGKYAHFVDAERIRAWMKTSGRTLLSHSSTSDVKE